MNRPTVSRATLRRGLAIRLSMPFAIRVSGGVGEASASSSDSNKIVDADNLLQPSDFWNRQWAYVPSKDETRRITDSSSDGELTLEYDLTGTLLSGEEYEIHHKFSAIELNNAINQAIQDGFPAFFDTSEDRTIVVQKYKTEYDLTDIDTIAYLHGVYIERPKNEIVPTIASIGVAGGLTTVTFAETDLSSVDTDWMISCYYGGGGGLLAQLESVTDSDNQISYLNPDLPTLTSDDEIKLFDTNEHSLGLYQLRELRTDTKEYPSKLYLPNSIGTEFGQRISLVYSHAPEKLSADTDVTVVPEEYIMLAALSTLYMSQMNDSRVDRRRYVELYENTRREAEFYKARNAFRYPDTPIWLEGTDGIGVQDNTDGNPMGWK